MSTFGPNISETKAAMGRGFESHLAQNVFAQKLEQQKNDFGTTFCSFQRDRKRSKKRSKTVLLASWWSVSPGTTFPIFVRFSSEKIYGVL